MKGTKKLLVEVTKLAAKADPRPLCERCNCVRWPERRARHEELMAIARQRLATKTARTALS